MSHKLWFWLLLMMHDISMGSILISRGWEVVNPIPGFLILHGLKIAKDGILVFVLLVHLVVGVVGAGDVL